MDISPTLTDNSPTLMDIGPTLTDISPTLMDISPTLTDNSPTLMDISPTLTDNSPTLTDRWYILFFNTGHFYTKGILSVDNYSLLFDCVCFHGSDICFYSSGIRFLGDEKLAVTHFDNIHFVLIGVEWRRISVCKQQGRCNSIFIHHRYRHATQVWTRWTQNC